MKYPISRTSPSDLGFKQFPNKGWNLSIYGNDRQLSKFRPKKKKMVDIHLFKTADYTFHDF